MVINWIWTSDTIQVGTFAFACAVVFASALGLIAAGRRKALRRGPPESSDVPEAIPVASLSSVLVAVGVASIVFGLAFGHFLIYFGAGLLVVSLGGVARELVAERRLRHRYRDEGRDEIS
jgi:formate hydrogenlyase subunit 3/multisubunit Na+/H+ antiporter MnhD subunit